MIPARGGTAATVSASRKILGSDSHCVLGRWLEWQYAGAKQFDAGSAIHGALQCLEPVDLAFGLAVAPWLGDRVLHRRQILPQCMHEATHAIEPLCGRPRVNCQ